MSRPPNGLVQLRWQDNGKGSGVALLTVPTALAGEINGMVGRLFACELTEDGILFRPMPAAPPPGDTPAWAKG
jgi:hypothetical protein